MRFFLVTHTSLVEAGDEEDAAQKAVAVVRDGRQVTVNVKSDEMTVKQVVVEAMSTEGKVLAPDYAEEKSAIQTAMRNVETTPQSDALDEPGVLSRFPRKLSAFLLPFTAGSVLTGVIDRLLL